MVKQENRLKKYTKFEVAIEYKIFYNLLNY